MSSDRAETTCASYDRLAAEYTRRIAGELAGKPFDRGQLDAFALLTHDLGPVDGLGCGPGHVAAWLHGCGVAATGVELSPAMVVQARALHPDIAFRPGSMVALDEHAALGGIVAFYSVIHVARDRKPTMFADWWSVLVPGGWLLLAFHVGKHDRHVDDPWGIPVDVDFCSSRPRRSRRGSLPLGSPSWSGTSASRTPTSRPRPGAATCWPATSRVPPGPDRPIADLAPALLA